VVEFGDLGLTPRISWRESRFPTDLRLQCDSGPPATIFEDSVLPLLRFLFLSSPRVDSHFSMAAGRLSRKKPFGRVLQQHNHGEFASRSFALASSPALMMRSRTLTLPPALRRINQKF